MGFIAAELLRFIVVKMSSNALLFWELKSYIFMITKLQVKGFYFFSKLFLKDNCYNCN